MKDFDITRTYFNQVRKETQLYKAYNILNIQYGSLTYNSDSGIDYDLFYDPNISFQKSSFTNYTIQTLMLQGVNIFDNVISQNDFQMVNEIILNHENKSGGLF